MSIDFKKYKRVFAFGCSFTNYVYPTWADIIMHEMPGIESYNFGRPGAGNQYIVSKIAEANARFNFCETDLVMVMYTTAFREDRYIEGSWRTYGNIFNQDFYNKNFVKNYVDPVGCVVRDMALIELSKTYLELLACDTLLLRAAPIEFEATSLLNDHMNSVVDVYKKTYYDFPPTLQESIFPNGWLENITRVALHGTYKDSHPLPIDYFNYLVKIGINVTDREYAEESTKKAFLSNPDNSDWPTYFPDVSARSDHSAKIML